MTENQVYSKIVTTLLKLSGSEGKGLRLADGHFMNQRNDLMGFSSRLFSPNLNQKSYNWLVIPILVVAAIFAIVSYLNLRNKQLVDFNRILITSSESTTKPQKTSSSKGVSNNVSQSSTSTESSGSQAKSTNTSTVTVNGKTVTVNGNGSYSQTTSNGDSHTSVDINNSSSSSGNSSNNSSNTSVNVNSNSSN